MNRFNVNSAVLDAPFGNEAVIHVRFCGLSFHLALSGPQAGVADDDAQVKQAVADYLEFPVARLTDYVIDRYASGNLTLRPRAVSEKPPPYPMEVPCDTIWQK